MTESDPELQLVILISGRGSNALAILDAIKKDRLRARLNVRAVIADSPINRPAAGLAKVAQYGVDTAQVNPDQHADKAGFEQALSGVIQNFDPDLLVLAGFMRVLSAQFIHQFSGRIVNIHPSLLPKYRGLNTHQRVLDGGDSKHGVSVHWVTAELDAGPVITQAEIQILPDDTAQSLADRLLIQEHRLYPATLALLAQNKVSKRHESNTAQTPNPWILDRDFDDAGRKLPCTRAGTEPQRN